MPNPSPDYSRLALQARVLFTDRACQVLPEIVKAVQARLLELVSATASARDMQDRRDAWLAFQAGGANWLMAVTRAWKAPLPNAGGVPLQAGGLDALKFELMDNEVMDDQILASRLALRLIDFASWELNDLRLRVQNLEQLTELPKNDILRPEVLAKLLIEQWVAVKLPRTTWAMVQDIVQIRLSEHLLVAYHAANEFLVQNGVMADIDLRQLVKRTPSAAAGRGDVMPPVSGRRPDSLKSSNGTTATSSTAYPNSQNASPNANYGTFGSGNGSQSSRLSGSSGHLGAASRTGQSNGLVGASAQAMPNSGNSSGSGSGVGSGASRSGGFSSVGSANGPNAATSGNTGGTGSTGKGAAQIGGAAYGAGGGNLIRPVGAGKGLASGGNGSRFSADGGHGGQGGAGHPLESSSPFDETRMQTATTPLARARMRAQGVLGTLKRLINHHVAGFDDTRAAQPSPQLARVLAGNGGAGFSTGGSHTLQMDMPGQVYQTAHVEQAASALRLRTSELKKAASSQNEKATIEIVALMFQAILAEDRIPAGVRVWFARLQMPVLRLAISEPEFFGSLEHPARQLIDRMGSCVLGFNADVSGGALEVEVKRVVQVIEQYPETGRRVFQLVYDEFLRFLSKFLSENGNAARAVSVAQQMEQKETMAIQFTIELRNMLKDIPVRDEIREFLFKVWAEALAISAMRSGPQHPETLTLKNAAASLVWASSAKPDRADRAKVIAELPRLLQLLRSGMTMLGMNAAGQDENIKIISDTLADAFLSKNSAIEPERIAQMAKRLTNLEDYLSDEDIGDLPLDTEALVMMLGIDTTDIDVITDGGSQPSDAMRAWAAELQLGAWFSLDHNGRVAHVQFAWRSDRKQLHLFASGEGRNYLIQARRLAAYLQSGLLVPTEEEALTVRATREALIKLEANPERLLG